MSAAIMITRSATRRRHREPGLLPVISADDRGAPVAATYGLGITVNPLTRDYCRAGAGAAPGRGAFRLSSSVDRKHGVDALPCRTRWSAPTRSRFGMPDR